jgi:hypothetical protein
MGLPVRYLGPILAVGMLLAAPAEAKLGDKIEAFQGSKLIQGDELFHFEGRVGARYRFTGARHCRFGQGLLAVDVDHQRIVQQIVVLPLPNNGREERTIREVAQLFLQDAGLKLPDAERRAVMESFVSCMLSGKRIERDLGKDYHLRIACQPQLASIMMAVGLKPEAIQKP